MLDYQHIGAWHGIGNTTKRVTTAIGRCAKNIEIDIVGIGRRRCCRCTGTVTRHRAQIGIQLNPGSGHLAKKADMTKRVVDHMFGKYRILGQVCHLLNFHIRTLGCQID